MQNLFSRSVIKYEVLLLHQFHSSLLMQENQHGVLKQNLEFYVLFLSLLPVGERPAFLDKMCLRRLAPLKGSLPITEISLERSKIQESV